MGNNKGWFNGLETWQKSLVILAVIGLIVFLIAKGWSIKAGPVDLIPPTVERDTSIKTVAPTDTTLKKMDAAIVRNKKENRKNNASVKIDKSKNVNVVTEPTINNSKNVVVGPNYAPVGDVYNEFSVTEHSLEIMLDSIKSIQRLTGIENKCVEVTLMQGSNGQKVYSQIIDFLINKGFAVTQNQGFGSGIAKGIKVYPRNNCVNIDVGLLESH